MVFWFDLMRLKVYRQTTLLTYFTYTAAERLNTFDTRTKPIAHNRQVL